MRWCLQFYRSRLLLQGYRNREIFIATQAPLKESIEDFWRLIWEYECYVLIMLLNEREDDEVRCLVTFTFFCHVIKSCSILLHYHIPITPPPLE
jgi:protein tyrosine phosphatase